jgi:lactoylglutathione lyase
MHCYAHTWKRINESRSNALQAFGPAAASCAELPSLAFARAASVRAKVSAAVTRIEHIAMWTGDIERLAKFYAKYLGATIGPKYTNLAKGFESRFIEFDTEARLELMQTSMLNPVTHQPGAQRMGLTHLALAVGAERHVDELTSALRADGFEVLDGPRRTGDGYYESVVLDPDGNRIELVADPTGSPNDRWRDP